MIVFDNCRSKGQTAMAAASQGEVTIVLDAIGEGSQEAMNRLFELVYDELRGIARGMMASERPGHTLTPTVIVHEVCIRLFMSKNLAKNLAGKHRRYFFGAATRAMRQILVDHARKNASTPDRDPLDDVLDWMKSTHRLDILDLHAALEQLEQLDSRKHEVVMLRFFGGLTMKEIAESLGVSLATVEKDWYFARAWLKKKLETDE